MVKKQKNIFLIIIIPLLLSASSAPATRMACVPEKTMLMGQDQGPLSCRYHWATTVKQGKDLYRCYVQFKEDGVKLMSVPMIQQEITPNIDLKHLDENPITNAAKARAALSKGTKEYIEKNNVIPAQAKLKISSDTDGDPILSTKAGSSPLFIRFAPDSEKFTVLKKLNYASGTSTIEELKAIVDHFSVFTRWQDLADNLNTILPCLGCSDCE